MTGTITSPRLAAVALFSALVLLLTTSPAPQGVYSDPAWQLRATQQRFEGASPSINVLVQPDEDDLTRDRGEWILWWAPGTPIVVAPLVLGGVRIGTSVRIVAALCLLAGAAGWARWFAHFRTPIVATVMLAALFPWMHYASNSLFMYSAEALVYATAPWLLLGGLEIARRLDSGPRRAMLPAILLGLALGAAYVLKYSELFLSLGILLFLALRAYAPGTGGERVARHIEGRCARWRYAAVLACGAASAVPVFALTAINRSRGNAANLVTASAGLHLDWRNVVAVLANPPLAMVDADGLLRYGLMHPSRPILSNAESLVWFGLPGGLLLWWLLAEPVRAAAGAVWHRRGESLDLPEFLAMTALAVSLGCMLLVWTVSHGASYEARHVAAASIAVLPLALALGVSRFRTSRATTRLLLAGTGLFYVAAPLAYGAASAVSKARRYGRAAYISSRSAIANPLLSSTDMARCLRDAQEGFDVRSDIWYLPDPITSLDIRGRSVVVDADMMQTDALRARTYRASRPQRVRALLAPRFEENGKGPVIRSSFVGASTWRRRRLPTCNYDAWDATVGAAVAPPAGIPRPRS